MGHIKEPNGIDFLVESKPLTDAEKKHVSEIIAHYKATGRKLKIQKSTMDPDTQKTSRISKKQVEQV